ATNFFDLNERGDHETKISSGSNGAAITSGTINVDDSSTFDSAGSIFVNTTTGTQKVTCTGKTSTTFTGCTSSGTGTMATGNAVVSPLTANGFTFEPITVPSD